MPLKLTSTQLPDLVPPVRQAKAGPETGEHVRAASRPRSDPRSVRSRKRGRGRAEGGAAVEAGSGRSASLGRHKYVAGEGACQSRRGSRPPPRGPRLRYGGGGVWQDTPARPGYIFLGGSGQLVAESPGHRANNAVLVRNVRCGDSDMEPGHHQGEEVVQHSNIHISYGK